MQSSDMRDEVGVAPLYKSVPESTTPVPLDVCGKLPPYLKGCLYRNGPGGYELHHKDGTSTPIAHWFDGLSMLHRFEIDGAANTVSYNSRLNSTSSSRAAKSVLKSKFNMGITFGVQDPCTSLFGKLFSMFLPVTKDPTIGKVNANVDVTVEYVPRRGILSRSDANAMYSFDAKTLEVSEFFSWNAVEILDDREVGSRKTKVTGNMTAAHGQYDAATGEYFNFVLDLGPNPGVYKVFCVNPNGKLEVLAEIRDRTSYVHSFALTKNYIIFIVFPQRVDSMKVLFERSLLGAMAFDENADTKFYVISRTQKKLVATYSSESFWCFHTVNSFEDSVGDIQIDLCRYENADFISQLYVNNLRTKDYSQFDGALLYRYSLPSVEQVIASQGKSAALPLAVGKKLCDTALELPRFNETMHLKEYRYAYGPRLGRDPTDSSEPQTLSRIAKIDLRTGASFCWSQPHGHCSEAIFVPNPDGVEEDDGCLVCVAFDASCSSSFLLILNARTMSEIARAPCPTVPAGFHGAYINQ